MSIDWSTIASVGFGAAIGTVGSICTTYFSQWLSDHRENKKKQANLATQIGLIYVRALESAYVFRSCRKNGVEEAPALDKAKYSRVLAELNLMCQDDRIEQAWKDYFFQSPDDRSAVTARKEELIELMKERIGSLTNNEGDNDAAAQ